MAEANVASKEIPPSPKKVLGGLFILVYIAGMAVYSVWFLITGGFNEPVTQLVSFFRETDISPRVFSWQYDVIVGFILLDLWMSIGSVVLIRVVTGKNPQMFFEKWKPLMSLRPSALLFKLLAGVSAEEIVFRWFPLAVLYPLWNTGLALWILVALSSALFAAIHIYNQEPKDRSIFFTLPQLLIGFVFSYIFLAYGFEAALAIHMLFDILLFILIKVSWEINPEAYAPKST